MLSSGRRLCDPGVSSVLTCGASLSCSSGASRGVVLMFLLLERSEERHRLIALVDYSASALSLLKTRSTSTTYLYTITLSQTL